MIDRHKTSMQLGEKPLRNCARLGFSLIVGLCLFMDYSGLHAYNLKKSKYSEFLYEINEIQFEGNEQFEEFELRLLINSSVTQKSPVFGIIDYYNKGIKANDYGPLEVRNTLDLMSEDYLNEIVYYNETITEDDVATLKSYYNIYGFHEVEISATFEFDSLKNRNILTFHISEGPRYRIAKINCHGIDSTDVVKSLYRIRKDLLRLEGSAFNENEVITAVQKLQRELKNNGYFYSVYTIKPVVIDNKTKTDEINILFSTGARQYIGDVKYINNKTNTTIDIATSVKKRYSAIKPGNLYRQNNIRRTEYNFNKLGFFEKIYIDTFDVKTPDTLNYRITTQLGNKYELDAGIGLNHTPADNYVNATLEGRFTLRNPFGGGENMVFYGNITANDINNIVTTHKFEGKLGVNFFQSMIWYYGGTRIGGAGNIEYSMKNLDGFWVDHWFLPKISFPWYLHKYTHFNKISFDLSLEGEYPRNYLSVIDTSVVDENNTNLIRSILFFETLNKYWSSDDKMKLWTAAILGVNAIGDHRNHPFSPTHGHFTRISTDIAGMIGVAEFVNINVTHQQYAYIKRKNIIHAYKINIGKVFYNTNDQSKYVPFEYQYFAGGANSNRGWRARSLHSSNIKPVLDNSAGADSVLSPKQYNILSNIYGSAGLFELNYECRYSFVKHAGISNAGSDRKSNFGVVGFVDIGNAYGWFVDPDDKAETNLNGMLRYFVNNLAVSTGFGIRYETPIGPVRLDLGIPVYGPIHGKDKLIFNRRKPIEDFKLYFGIGHTF